MKIQNRGPKLTFNKLGPFFTAASPELASRDLSSEFNVNTDFDAPRTGRSPKSTFPTASPGSVVFHSQPTTMHSTPTKSDAPQDSKSHLMPDLMEMSTELDSLTPQTAYPHQDMTMRFVPVDNNLSSFKEYLQGGERGSKIQRHRKKVSGS